MKAEDMTPLETVEFLAQKAEQLTRLADHAKSVAQRIHQAYHCDKEGTFLNCSKSVCRETAAILYEVTRPYERHA